MSKILYTLFIFSVLNACSSNKGEKKLLNDFEKSFKEEKGEGFIEHFDSISNVYSNFRYHVAFDAPDNWRTDVGVSEHTIFRAFQSDSSMTFSINVIEQKSSETENESNIWELYQRDKEQMDFQVRTTLENQLNSKLENYVSQKTHLRNNVSLMRKFNYKTRHMGYEYDLTNTIIQTLIGDFTYTFTLSIPKIYYDVNPEFYDNIFLNVYFLKDGELLDEVIKKSQTKNK